MYRSFDLFADGSCKGSNKPGGWANILRITRDDGVIDEAEYSGGDSATTNNRMELYAVLHGLDTINKMCSSINCEHSVVVRDVPVRVISDSSYVVHGMNKWLEGWIRRKWKTASGKPVKNRDLWEQLYIITKQLTIEAIWVAGHIGHPENERCDKKAKEETTKMLKKCLEKKNGSTV